MSDKRTTVATIKSTKSPTGKLQTEPSSAPVDVSAGGFYVNSDAGLNRHIETTGSEKNVDENGNPLAEDETNYYEENPTFGIGDGEAQYIYEWLDNLSCDFKADTSGVIEDALKASVKARLETLTSPITGDPEYPRIMDEASLYEPFSESIGSLIAVETIKDSTNTPVTESAKIDSKHLAGQDIALPSTLAYDQIGHQGGSEGEKDINKNITAIMRSKIDNIFGMNMLLIKDPKIWDKATDTFISASLYRSDGTGYKDLKGNPDLEALTNPANPANPVMALEGKSTGVAHGTNLISDTRHYDRMNSSYKDLQSEVAAGLGTIMFKVWKYRRGRKNVANYTEPLTITFPVERIETSIDAYTFDPIILYIKSVEIDKGEGKTVTIEEEVATRYITNKQILGSSPVS